MNPSDSLQFKGKEVELVSSLKNENKHHNLLDISDDISFCCSKFSEKDSIMDVQLLNTMKKFVSSGGKPQVAVQLLSDNYRGYAPMTNLVCSWLKLCGEDQHSIDAAIQDKLKLLIKDKFEPKKADTIFKSGPSAPSWLEEMIKQREWRNLIYQLSEQFKDCLMLGFAIQRISDAGHHDEIASLATASTYFQVFNRVLLERLNFFCTNVEQPNFNEYIIDFKKMCSHDQHTYLYAQILLHWLIKEKNGNNLRRLIQELENCPTDKESMARKLNSNIAKKITPSGDVVQSLYSIIRTGSTTLSDVLKLYEYYSSDNPPPVELLQNPTFFEVFIRDLFTPHKATNINHRQKYYFILAYASCIKDQNEIKEEKKELNDTITVLEEVQPICQQNLFGSELQAALNVLKMGIEYPIIAMGILYWIQANLMDQNYYTTAYDTLSIPIHLNLLNDIVDRHPQQQQKVLDLLILCFREIEELEISGLLAVEMKRHFLDNMLHLIQSGFVLPVLSFIEQSTEKTDQSLIRHFLKQLFDMIEPPYSKEFILTIIRIINSPATIEALAQSGDAIISNFCEHCLHVDYGFTEIEQSTLVKLRNELLPETEQ